MKTTFIAACLCLVQIATLFAQGKEISEKDLKEIQAEMKTLSDKIEVILKKDEKLYKAMKEEIENINKLKVTKDKNLAIEIYKTRYSTQYGQVLTKAGINMKNIVSDWNLKYKNYSFKLNNGYAVSLTAKANPPAGGYALPNTPTTTTTPIKDFLQTEDISCGLIGFTDVEFGDKSISASSTGVVAGGCTGAGFLTKEFIVPDDAKSVFLKVEGRTEASCYAVGVVGMSYGSGVASFFATNIFKKSYTFVGILAPFLWAGGDRLFEDFSEEISLDGYKGEYILIRAEASATGISGVCCATSGNAKTNITKAELIVTK
jgi:hypothetical protein